MSARKNGLTCERTGKSKGSGKIAAFFYPYIKNRSIFLMFIPVLLWFILFDYVPMHGILIAFEDFKIGKGVFGSKFVGFANFRKLFQSPTFLRAFVNTVVISALRIVTTFPAPIILALLLNEVRHKRFKKVAQTITYLPHFLSWVVLAGIFLQILSPTSGVVNEVLNALGFESVYFLGDPKWFRFTLIITGLWKEVGWSTVIYMAALTSIDMELYEAAELAGANRWQKCIHITLPCLMPIITIQLILTAGSIMNGGFDQIFNLYNDGVMKVGDIIDTYVYRKGLESMGYSFATAAGLFKNVISFAMVLLTNRASKRFTDGEYGLW